MKKSYILALSKCCCARSATAGQAARNFLLLLAVIGLVLWFRSSSALASAYGMAVTAMMLLTTLMIGYVVFRIWRWNIFLALPVFLLLLSIDIGLVASSATKFVDGGWLPVGVAALLVFIFATWRKGMSRFNCNSPPASPLPMSWQSTGAFSARRARPFISPQIRPTFLLRCCITLQANHVLHEHVVIVTIQVALKPLSRRPSACQ